MNKAPKQPPKKQSPLVPVMMIALVVIAAGIAFKLFQSSPPKPSAAGEPIVEVARSAPAVRPAQMPAEAATPAAATVAPAPNPVLQTAPIQPPVVALVDAKGRVSALAGITGKEPVSPEQAQKWKDSLQQLIRQGASSVPAIQQFLSSNLDASFAEVGGKGLMGYNSLRSAMLDALGQIGGPDSTAAMLQILQTSIFPTDIATLAATLNTQAPGQYEQAILDAARQQLNMAALDQLGGANVLPLFQALASEAAAGASVSADLAQYSEKWPFYAAIALAGLPDGAGVPSLVQIAQGTVAGNQAAAMQALAELAPQNAEALNYLVDIAKNGQLSDATLAQLAPFLGGRQYLLGPPQDATSGGVLTFHMASGNQDFAAYDGNGAMTQPQISQRISIIDQLLQAVPAADTGTVGSLQEQRAILAGKQAP